jgi:hypothetical protein
VFRKPHCGVDDVAAKPIVRRGGGSDLDDLLKAALDAAFALPQVRDAAVAVAEELHLDVAGARERDAGLGPAALEGRVQLIG